MAKIEPPPKRPPLRQIVKIARSFLDKNLDSQRKWANNEYPYWDRVKYKELPDGIDPESFWHTLRLAREMGMKDIHIGDQRFGYNISSEMERSLHKFDMAGGGFIANAELPKEVSLERYQLNSIMEESIASSQIEGAATSRKKAKEMLRSGSKPRNNHEQMILNNYKTMVMVKTLLDMPLTEKLLLDIHASMTRNTLDDPSDEGRYRSDNEVKVVDVIDGEVVHDPPDHSLLPKMMKDLIRFFNDEDKFQFIHPLVKGSIIHFLIGYIHPFADGNGRTARALFYWYMLKKGYWLTEYISISRMIKGSRAQYDRAYLYCELDGLDLTYFVMYSLKIVEKAHQELIRYVQRKLQQDGGTADAYSDYNLNSRQIQILGYLEKQPKKQRMVKEIRALTNSSDQTARNDLEKLVGLNLVSETKVDNKTRVYRLKS